MFTLNAIDNRDIERILKINWFSVLLSIESKKKFALFSGNGWIQKDR